MLLFFKYSLKEYIGTCFWKRHVNVAEETSVHTFEDSIRALIGKRQ